jgi:hypothetical protein
MAPPPVQAGSDVPLHGGFTRFELELEVRSWPSYVTAPILFHQDINTSLVCAMSGEPRLSQLPRYPKVL